MQTPMSCLPSAAAGLTIALLPQFGAPPLASSPAGPSPGTLARSLSPGSNPCTGSPYKTGTQPC